MKTFNVKINYCHESFNGYDHHCTWECIVEARNYDSAINKGKKLFPKWWGQIEGSSAEEIKNETIPRNIKTGS